MLPLRTLLCPVALTAPPDRPLGLAVALCRAEGARLVLHHNMVELAIGSGVGWMWAAGHPELRETESQAGDRLNALLGSLPDDIPREARLTHGPFVDSILSVADAIEADLIVMNTRGAAALDDENGSTTERLIASGRRAVLAVHEAASEHRSPMFREAGERENLVAVVDPMVSTAPAASAAFELAGRFPFDVHLVGVLPPRKGGAAPQAAARQFLHSLVPSDFAGRTEIHVDVGDAAALVASTTDRLGATCVVATEPPGSRFGRWFRRDVAAEMVHSVPCPIWFVPATVAAARPATEGAVL